jgi:hypothetical protein
MVRNARPVLAFLFAFGFFFVTFGLSSRRWDTGTAAAALLVAVTLTAIPRVIRGFQRRSHRP